MIFKIISLLLVFVMLYVVAFISNRHYRDSDDILFISKTQWEAIIIMILPTLVALFLR